MIAPADAPLAVIVGGGSGLGLQAAHRFSPTHSLLIADVSAENLNAATEALRAGGASVTAAVVDVTDFDQVKALAEQAATLGPLGILLPTAGLSPHMATPARILEVNLIGTANVLAAFVDLAREGTVVVGIASVSGHRDGIAEFDDILLAAREPDFLERIEQAAHLGDDSSMAYALSKRGVIAMVEAGAREWGRRGARIVSISPGVIDTPMAQSDLDVNERAKAFIGSTTPPRLGRPDEVISVIEFLCSPAASFVTGTDIRVDGGGLATLMRHGPPEGAALPPPVRRVEQGVER